MFGQKIETENTDLNTKLNKSLLKMSSNLWSKFIFNDPWNDYDSILCIPDILKSYPYLREKRMNHFHDWANKNGLRNVSYDFDKLVFL